MDIQIKMTGFDDLMLLTDPKNVRSAASKTLNDMARAVRTEGVKAIRDDFNLKKKDITDKIKFRAARVSDLEARLSMRVHKRGIGLMRFNPTWTRGRVKVSARGGGYGPLFGQRTKRVGRNQGVSVRIRRGVTTRLPRAFIARGMRGSAGLDYSNTQVWVRGKNGALIPKRIPKTATLFFDPDRAKRMKRVALRTMGKRFSHHYDQALARKK